MVSWQTRALEAFLVLKRWFSDPSGKLDVAAERADVESLARMFKPLGALTCEPVDADGVPAEWIGAPGGPAAPVVLFLHGGSFNSGSIVSHRTLAGNVALASGARALLIDYRLAPEHPFPAQIDDSLKAFNWLRARGIPERQIVLAGDSAGGTLALALLVLLRDQRQPLPAAAVCLSPAPDLTFTSPSWTFNRKKDLMLDPRKEHASVDLYLVGTDRRTPLASPTFADLHGLPPLLIQVGSHELLLSDAEVFAERARQAGVDVTLEVWPGMQHEWQFGASFLPEGRRALNRVGEFVRTVLPRQGASASRPGA